MDPKDAQTEPKNQQIEAQGATKNKEHATLSTTGGKVEPQMREKHKKGFKIDNKARKWAAKSWNTHKNT